MTRPLPPISDLAHRFHPEVAFGGFTDIDSTVIFYARVQELLEPDAVAIDVGCGRGTQIDDPVRIRRELRILRGKCKRVVGLDIDAGAAANPFIDEFRIIAPDQRWPMADSSADLALADFVLEHVSDPAQFISEARRVLRTGGVFCLRTINAWSYVGIASRITPSRMHRRVLARVQPERHEQDVFPKSYACNTVPGLERSLELGGFDSVVYGVEAEPAYVGLNPATYALGLAYRRLAPGRFKVGIVAWGRRR